MSEEIHETPSTTPNFQTELAAQLAELMPEVIADGKVDVELSLIHISEPTRPY